MAAGFLMKDGLGPAAVARIGRSLQNAFPPFPKDEFYRQAVKDLGDMELRARVDHLIGVLHRFYPSDFIETARILDILPAYWDFGDPDDNLRSFAAWPIIDYIGIYGLDDPQTSVKTLLKLTSLFSAEFAIRPFLMKHTKFTLDELNTACKSPDHHIRRLVSEGTRPRLPWGKRLDIFIDDPQPVLSLLENLKDDKSEYVRRSVGNNLNDISKDHPQLVVDRCALWLNNDSRKRRQMVKRATRTLVKRGWPSVWPLLGYASNPKIDVRSFKINKKQVERGGEMLFSAELKSSIKRDQKLEIDYALHFKKSNGKLSPKIFKLKTLILGGGEQINIQKKQSFREVSTRKLYNGQHAVELLINGKPFAKQFFDLI